MNLWRNIRYRRQIAKLKRLQRDHDENLLCAMVAETAPDYFFFITIVDEQKREIDELKSKIYGGTK